MNEDPCVDGELDVNDTGSYCVSSGKNTLRVFYINFLLDWWIPINNSNLSNFSWSLLGANITGKRSNADNLTYTVNTTQVFSGQENQTYNYTFMDGLGETTYGNYTLIAQGCYDHICESRTISIIRNKNVTVSASIRARMILQSYLLDRAGIIRITVREV